MKKLLLPLAIAASCAQADYQAELRYSYLNAKADDGISSEEADLNAIQGTVYFNRVDSSKGPYAEAAFLSKASSLFVAYSDADDLEIDTTAYGTHIVVEDKWIIDVAASDTDAEGSTVKTYTLGGGLYLDDMSTLTLGYTQSDHDLADSDSDAIVLSYKRLAPLSGGSFYNVETDLAYIDQDDLDETIALDFAADYYLDKHFSAGLILSYIDADAEEGDEAVIYGVRTSFYFSDKLGITFSYAEEDNDLVDFETWSASLNARF
jgi:hypothetical protein